MKGRLKQFHAINRAVNVVVVVSFDVGRAVGSWASEIVLGLR